MSLFEFIFGDVEYGDPKEDVLYKADELQFATVAKYVTQREPITFLDGSSVEPCYDIQRFGGIALYDGGEGEEIAIASYGTQVQLRAGEDIESGQSIKPTESGDWVATTESNTVNALRPAKRGDLFVARIAPEWAVC